MFKAPSRVGTLLDVINILASSDMLLMLTAVTSEQESELRRNANYCYYPTCINTNISFASRFEPFLVALYYIDASDSTC